MPNWCHNKLTVSGEPDVLLDFVQRVKLEPRVTEQDGKTVTYGGQPLSLDKLVPRPEDLDDWYGWSLQHWGTKWDASFEAYGGLSAASGNIEASQELMGLDITGDTAIYVFDTAWSPPVPWVLIVSDMYPDLAFELIWGEAGHGDAGRIKVIAGIVVEQMELPLEKAIRPEQMWF